VSEERSYLDDLRLDGRGFVVLGAGQGMGLEASRALRNAGARVVCVDIDAGRARSAADAVQGHAVVGDILDPKGFSDMLEAARSHLGAIHGVVDIVGGSIGGFLEDTDDTLIQQNFTVNLDHAFRVVREAGAMIAEAGGGTITFLGSMAGLVSMPRQAVYGAAKAGLHHLVRSAAAELGPKGVRVNAVAPGFIATPRIRERFTEENFAELVRATPLGRVGEPRDIARILLFLSSDMSSFITGQTLLADAGITAQLRVFARPPGT
jgi:NAD(P)-dependent dehydrogenase (short-subunit alcohol dehydrogenase family)